MCKLLCTGMENSKKILSAGNVLPRDIRTQFNFTSHNKRSLTYPFFKYLPYIISSSNVFLSEEASKIMLMKLDCFSYFRKNSIISDILEVSGIKLL